MRNIFFPPFMPHKHRMIRQAGAKERKILFLFFAPANVVLIYSALCILTFYAQIIFWWGEQIWCIIKISVGASPIFPCLYTKKGGKWAKIYGTATRSSAVFLCTKFCNKFFFLSFQMFGMACYVNLCERVGDLEVLILLTSCICHDLDHPGYNNIYQV